jgi:hypothetical protein
MSGVGTLTNQKEGHGKGSGRMVGVGGIKGSFAAVGFQLLLSYFEEVYQRLPRFTQS